MSLDTLVKSFLKENRFKAMTNLAYLYKEQAMSLSNQNNFYQEKNTRTTVNNHMFIYIEKVNSSDSVEDVPFNRLVRMRE